MKMTSKVLMTALCLCLVSLVVGCSKENVPSNSEQSGVTYPPAPVAVMEREMTTVDGSTMKLTDKKGKVILVNLWATWCGPCIEEMPDLVKMQEELGPQGFEVIGVNTETTEGSTIEELDGKVKAFIAEHGLNYQNTYISEGMFDEFVKLSKLPGIPQSFIIDRDGKLRGVFAGGGKKNIDKMWETSRKVLSGS